jgi:hypothetical protein
MKNKIYSKLFEFVDPKTWTKNFMRMESSFYGEYNLVFECSDLTWEYKVYPLKTYDKNKYNDNPSHKGIVTLNKSGKVVFTIAFFLFAFIYPFAILHSKNIYLYSLILLGSIAISFFIVSIFNWKIYKTFRLAQYYIKNKEKIEKKEETEKLNNDIVELINKTISKNPKLARKTKLKHLNKKT